MTIKEKIKDEIDSLPSDLLEDVYRFIYSLKQKKKSTRELHSFQLKGQFDELDVRKEAYE